VLRRLLRVVIVLGVLVAIVMAWTRRSRGGAIDVALPDVPLVAPMTPPTKPAPWRDPVDGACPPGYEIKAKLSSGIFHEPGMVNYARTTPDRCYASADAAVADGLRPAKR
jgi:micrococcal nuclease